MHLKRCDTKSGISGLNVKGVKSTTIPLAYMYRIFAKAHPMHSYKPAAADATKYNIISGQLLCLIGGRFKKKAA